MWTSGYSRVECHKMRLGEFQTWSLVSGQLHADHSSPLDLRFSIYEMRVKLALQEDDLEATKEGSIYIPSAFIKTEIVQFIKFSFCCILCDSSSI